ncbi:hypothetical protein T459_16483 [Capsicum annuum]|uniref:RNA-directed DNA polymerase n=1 Tax=Capsicum annuum TaxID=4072 RepID=A0A2G2Z955_CAPAN|nr:hypothetical protein T459_16483 [Capsicum annuum]
MAYDGDEEVHGGDNLGKTKSRKRDKSRNKDEAQLPVSEAVTNVEDGEGSASGSLDERIVSTEAGLAVLGHRFKTLESNVGTLEAAALEGLDEVKADLSEQNEEHKEGLTSLELKLTEALSALHEEFGAKLSEVMLGQSALQEEVADLKQQLEAARVGGNHGSVAYHDVRIEAPKPNVFKGERNAQDVENFIWQLESYFEHVKIIDGAARIRIATMYLSDVAMLWWRRKKVDMERGLCSITHWDQFTDELKEQFYPQNVVDEARRKLRELKQTSSIHNYVREFTKLSLLVTSFSSEDLLFFFLDGLQNWAKQELRRRNVKTVDEAIKVAESLTDFHADYAKSKDNRNKPIAAKGERGDKGKDKFIPNKNREFKGERNQPSSFRKNYEEKKKGVANRDSGCYLCGDTSHFARSCPSLSKLGAMVAATRRDQASAQTGSSGEQEAQAATSEKGKGHAIGLFNHMALFNHMTLASLAAKKHSVRARESLFVDGEVNGRAVRIMVDTGATHNFVTAEKAKELGLAFVTSDSMLKTVNCLPTNVNGLAPRVSLTLGGWKGETDFSVVPMDVFDIVLGLDFWYEINAFISPRLNQLAICDEGGSCIVPLIRVAQSGTRLSAMQLVKGFKKGEPTFLATSMEEHVRHLQIVFNVLRENELCVKREKCTFAQPKVQFLGHTISQGQIQMDSDKVEAIRDWEVPTKVPELRSFLGLANYYRRFILGYSDIAAPLTDLLKKNRAWEWNSSCQGAFDNLKAAIIKEPVLALPDFTKLFEVQTDASDFAIGGVLMQEGHPIAFESRKLNEAERRYTVHEKEMTAIVHCLRTWRHYLLGAHFIVKTDNVATSYFQSQKKLSPKQARWQDFLAEFDYSLEYKPGKANVVADALSRKVVLSALLSTTSCGVLDTIKEGMEHDPVAKQLLDLARKGKTQKFWEEDGLLYTTGRRVYVPRWKNLRRLLIKEGHDTTWAGHPGQKRTMALLEAAYYWPRMRDDIEVYVRTCLVCQQDKVEHKAPGGLLEPLPTAEKPWDSVTMDFITCLPNSEGCGTIMVVVDRFSKYATFSAATSNCKAKEAARLFLKDVVKLWGVPRHIISDRDPRFTGAFWKELFSLLGSELHFSTSFHPQTDGQTERVNGLLECYLRHFVSANQKDWSRLLDTAQFSYNLQRSESTGRSPFELATGQQPNTPQSLPVNAGMRNPGAYHMAKAWEEQVDMARSYLDKAARKMKKFADRSRRPVHYRIGDKVMVKLNPRQFKSLRSVNQSLIRRYEGPFEIVAKVGKISYKLDMPSHLKIYPVFHASKLKPYFEDKEDVERGKSSRAQIFMTSAATDKQIEDIIDHQLVRGKGWGNSSAQFLVHWKGQSPEEASWEKYEDLWPFKEKVHKYLQLCGAAVVAKSGGGECDAPRHYPLNSSRFGHNSVRFGHISEPDGAPSTSRDKANVGASLGGQNTSSGQHLLGFEALTS